MRNQLAFFIRPQVKIAKNCLLAVSLGSLLSLAPSASLSGNLTLAQEPLYGATTSPVYPNLMFVFDNSGSMSWDFVPDYVNDYGTSTGGEPSCFGSGTISTADRQNCYVGDPPFMSPDFNLIYYNPDYTFEAAADGASSTSPPPRMASQNITSTSLDPYGKQKNSQLTNGNSGSTIDLTSKYPDRRWCAKSGQTLATTGAWSWVEVLTFSGSVSINKLNVNGTNVLSGASTASNVAATIASNLKAKVSAAGYTTDYTSGATGFWLIAPTGTTGTPTYSVSSGSASLGISTFDAACVANVSGYQYPDRYRSIALAAGGGSSAATARSGMGVPAATGNYALGAPYYWRIIPKEYCSTEMRTSCVPWTSASADSVVSTVTYSTNLYCASPARIFSACQAVEDTSHRYPAKCTASACVEPGRGSSNPYAAAVRFCKAPTKTLTDPLVNCQGTYNDTANYTIPKFLGYVIPSAGDNAYGTITIPATLVAGQSITSITIDGSASNLLSSAYTVPFGATPSSVATGVAALINSSYTLDGVRGISKSASGNVITIASAVLGIADNGKTFTVNGPAGSSPGTKASATLTIQDISGGSSDAGTYRLGPICVGTVSGTAGSTTDPEKCSGPIISNDVDALAVNLSTSDGKKLAAEAVRNAINNSAVQGYTATSADDVVTITAPSAGVFTSPINIMTPTGGGTSATGTIVVYGTTSGALVYRIDSIKVGTTTISSGAISGTWDLATVTGTQSAASAIAASIQNGYSATSSGSVVSLTATTPGVAGNGILTMESTASQATGSISVGAGSSGVRNYHIDSITVATSPTPTVIASDISFSVDLSTTAGRQGAATAIKNAIGNGYTGSCTGGATCTSTTVTITANVLGGAYNGVLSVSSAAAIAPTAIKLTVGDAGTSSANTSVSGIWMTGCLDTALNKSSGRGILKNAITASNSASTMASRIASAQLSTTNPAFSSISASGTQVTLVPNVGSRLDGCSLAVQSSGGDLTFTWDPAAPHFTGLLDVFSATTSKLTGGVEVVPGTITGMSGGASVVLLPNSRTAFSGGANGSGTIAVTTQAFSGGAQSGVDRRAEVGSLARCDIVSTADCHGLGAGKFYRSPDRTDCAHSDYCTYDEEKVNFANWYAYNRTRLQTLKTGAGLAFSGIGATYRIGYAAINAKSTGSSAEFLRAADFTLGQRQSWYAKLYAQSTETGGGTPLRGALTRMGQMYAHAGVLAAGDPVQYSCQQNFTLLTTDGYWNTDPCSDVLQVDNSTQIGQQDGAPAVSQATVDAVMWDGDYSGDVCQGGGASTASSVGTLADVSYYYAHTDLRTSTLGNCENGVLGNAQNVCKNNVPRVNTSEPVFQHMNTYTLGLGVNGTLRFQNDYANATSGDFYDIKTKVKKWPQVTPGGQTTVDDLWHAGVNGFGKYFSASNPVLLKRNLDDALSSIKSSIGSGAAAATSAQALSINTQSYAYVASYQSVQWTGNLEGRSIDATTAKVNVSAAWCVSDVAADPKTGVQACSGKLKTQVGESSDSRNIYFFDPSVADTQLASFNLANLTSAGLSAYFNPCPTSGTVTALSQCAAMSAALKAGTTPAALVSYLRGQYGQEIDRTSNTYQSFRNRKGVMGDAVGSQPIFQDKPNGVYTDAGYAGYKSEVAAAHTGGFPKTVYLGANDGMLHAFDAVDGTERWAYVPGPMLPKMRILADENYKTADQHRYFVNGSPTVVDVCFGSCSAASDWHTLLVGAYGAGGKGYFALDVTDPTHPKALWEFSDAQDADMGYSFGEPIITKVDGDGWVVVLPSGYENTSGSGAGVLFLVSPDTGAVIRKFSNNSGSVTSPSGLAKIEAFIIDAAHDNTATDVYGGDLNGNVWRFRLPNTEKISPSVVKVAQLAGTDGKPQPVTTKPLLTTLDDTAKTRYLIVATGQLLQVADKTNKALQSVYAFEESYDALCPMDTETTVANKCENAPEGLVEDAVTGSIGSVSTVPSTFATAGHCAGATDTAPPYPTACPNGLRNQLSGKTLVIDYVDDSGRTHRKTSPTSIDPTKEPVLQGCYVNLPDSGERVNIDPLLLNGEVVVATNVPEDSVCTSGGHSFLNVFNYKTCQAMSSVESASALAVGLTVVTTADGQLIPLITEANDPTPQTGDSIPQPPPNFTGRRMGWRLLSD